jgi:atypical dual specificity phosphatase
VPTYEQIDQFVSETEETINQGKGVVAHCFARIGRTGTMIACYLVAKEKLTADAAIKLTRQKRAGSLVTAKQEAIVFEYAARLKQQAKQTKSK